MTGLVLTMSAWAGTNVRIATTVGNIDLELFDEARPVTVANFLSYVRDGSYKDGVIHRLVPNFVVQGGAHRLTVTSNSTNIDPVTAKPAIQNEFNGDPLYTNAYGTITMAKVEGKPDSATSSWFINLKDNNTGNATEGNLDLQNEGFTVFGRVKAGWEVLEVFKSRFPIKPASGPGVYDRLFPFGLDFREFPQLGNALTVSTLIFSDVYVLPPPTLKITGSRQRQTNIAVLAINGKASRGVDTIEWQIGSNGAVKTVPGSTDWRIRVVGLKRGRNVVTLRAKANIGLQSASQQIVIVRR